MSYFYGSRYITLRFIPLSLTMSGKTGSESLMELIYRPL